MDLHDPALVVVFFFAAGDRGAEHLWESVTTTPVGGESQLRHQRTTMDGATVIQVVLERSGVWESVVWQDLMQEMYRWLGRSWESPPGRPWGISRFYLGGAVAGLYEEQLLLSEGLALPEEPARRVTHLPVGRLWLVNPPAVAERGSNVASYAWFYAPAGNIRTQLERLLWQESAPLLRAELYLHRALYQLRQYQREERAAFWVSLEQLESIATSCVSRSKGAGQEGQLREICRVVTQGMARLSRLHNLLRSSAHLYRQIGTELRQEEGALFSWYEERLREATIQWGYDLDRADRAAELARMAFLALIPLQPSQPEQLQQDEVPARDRPTGSIPPIVFHLFTAAVLALCLVDENWVVVLVRTGVILLVLSAGWGLTRLWNRRKGKES
jgi:hypothetical protein